MGGIEFGNPLMLWGASLALLPLLIHLFSRRRARPHPFAAIEFVLRSRRRTASRMRLKRILLFATRTLLLLAIPLALARPQPKRDLEAAATPQGPAATAIVLDTSLSMNYALDGKSLLDRAKEMARDALTRLQPEDPVTLVLCEEEAPAPDAPGFDRRKVRAGIDEAKTTFAAQDLTACLHRAARALAESPLPAKRILLATDLTAAAFRLDVPPPTITTSQGEVRPEVVLLDAARGAEHLPNSALTALRVEPAPAVGHRAYQFTMTVANHSPAPLKDVTCLLKVRGEVVAKGFIDVPPRGTAVKTLTYRFPEGGTFSGAVELSGDALGADDARHFVLQVPRDVRALVVNGAPHPVRFRDEAFFVETALSAPGSPVRPTLRDPDAATQENFSDYDLVLLLNVRALAPDKIVELRNFVENGGGLFISLGENVDPDAWNDAFGDLLPRPLHLVKTAVERSSEDAERKAARFDKVDFTHPALSVFTGEAQEGVLSARTYRYFLLSPGDASQVTQLASFDDGAPALLEARRGRGRVLLYTSTVDRDWSDWPIRTSFLPAMQRMSGWLAGTLEERGLEQHVVGRPKLLEPEAGVTVLRVTGPDGKPRNLVQGADGKPEVTGTGLPGVYSVHGRIAGTEQPLHALAFAVNVEPHESNLTRLEEKELKAYFGEKTRTERGVGGEDRPPEFPMWSALLALGVAFFFAEGLLVRK